MATIQSTIRGRETRPKYVGDRWRKIQKKTALQKVVKK
jgi:hypothetical protein